MIQKLCAVIVLLMAMLNLVPPLFSRGVYFDNVYYTILYVLLSYLAIVVPYIAPKMGKVLRATSFMLGGWFLSGLAFEIINFSVPDVILNLSTEDEVYAKIVPMFALGMGLLFAFETWNQWKPEK